MTINGSSIFAVAYTGNTVSGVFADEVEGARAINVGCVVTPLCSGRKTLTIMTRDRVLGGRMASTEHDLTVSPILGEINTSKLDACLLAPLKEFGQAAVHGAVDSPYKGLKQLAEQSTGLSLPDFQLVNDPEPAQFNTVRWHAQQFGGAVGMILPFCLVSGGVKGAHRLAANVLTKEATSIGTNVVSQSLTRRLATPIAETAAAGFIFDFTMRPVQKEDGEFWSARLRNGTSGALTFATLTGGVLGLQEISKRRLAATPWMEHSTGRDFGRHIAAGTIAGALDAQSRSLLAGKGFADIEQTAKSAYTFAVVGGAIRGKEEVIGRVRQQKTVSEVVSNDTTLQEQVLSDPAAAKILLDHGNRRIGPDQAENVADFLGGDQTALNTGLEGLSFGSRLSSLYYRTKWKLQEGTTEARRATYAVLNRLNMRHPLQRLGDLVYGTDAGPEPARPELTAQNNPLNSFKGELTKFFDEIRATEEQRDQLPVNDWGAQRKVLDQQRQIRTEYMLKLLQMWHGTAERPGVAHHTDAQLATPEMPVEAVAKIRAVLSTKANHGELSQALAELAPEASKDLDVNAIDVHDGLAQAKERFFGYDETALQQRMGIRGVLHYMDHCGGTALDWSPCLPSPQLSHMFHGSVSNSLPSILTERGMLPASELRLRGIEQNTGESALERPRHAISLTRDFSEAWAYHRHSPAYLTGFPIIFGVAKGTAAKSRLAGCGEPGEILADRLHLGKASLLTRLGLVKPDITHLYVPDGQVSNVVRQLQGRRIGGVTVLGLSELKTPEWKQPTPEELERLY